MLDLSLPTQEEVKEQVQQELAPTPQEQTSIKTTVEKQTEEIMSVDIESIQQRREYTNVVESFGDELLKQSQKKKRNFGKKTLYIK